MDHSRGWQLAQLGKEAYQARSSVIDKTAMHVDDDDDKTISEIDCFDLDKNSMIHELIKTLENLPEDENVVSEDINLVEVEPEIRFSQTEHLIQPNKKKELVEQNTDHISETDEEIQEEGSDKENSESGIIPPSVNVEYVNKPCTSKRAHPVDRESVAQGDSVDQQPATKRINTLHRQKNIPCCNFANAG